MRFKKSIAILLAVFNMTTMIAGSSITAFAEEKNSVDEDSLVEEESDVAEDLTEDSSGDVEDSSGDVEDSSGDVEEFLIDEPACIIPQENEDSEPSLTSAESAKSYILNMNIVATDGKTYHVSDFSEEYVAIFFGRSSCFNTNSMVEKVASIRDNKGKSIKIIIMDIDEVDNGLADFANQYSALASIYSLNNSYMLGLYRSYKGESSNRVTLPIAAVLDSDRNVIFCDSGYHVDELPLVFKKTSDFVTYSFDMTYGQTEARSMLSSVNSFRTGSQAWVWDVSDSEKVYYNNLSKLTYDYGLEQVAMQRAAEVAVYYAHTRPSGKSCFTAYTSIGGAAENIAVGYSTADAVFEAWREDNQKYWGQGHRRNMLGKDYKYIGIAMVQIDGTNYWVQEFNTVATDTTQTTACDTQKTVSIEIDKENISSKTVITKPAKIGLEPDETAQLPEVYERLALTESKPGSGHYVSGITTTWSGYDSKIISVDTKNKKITALKEGSTTLTATADGESAQVTVKVEDKPNVSKVVIKKYDSLEDAKADRNATTYENGSLVEIDYGKKIYLAGKAVPIVEGKKSFSDATTSSVSDSSIITYSADSKEVYGKAVGSSTITFTAVRDTAKAAKITVKVKEVPITELKFDESSITMSTNASRDLELKYEPPVTSQQLKNVVWSSSNTDVLEVKGSESDASKAVISSKAKEGTATITAKMGKLSASVQVTVAQIVKLDKHELVFTSKPGVTESLSASLALDSYKESELKWTSSAPSVLKVEKGVMTILKNVEAVTKVTITAATKDGLYSDSCNVTLKPWPRAEAPKASLEPGNVERDSVLLLSVGDSATGIFYTIDYNEKDGITKPGFDKNGNPDKNTKLFDEAIVIDKSMTVCAVSQKEGCQDSNIVTFKYVVTYSYGDVNTSKLKALFADASRIPEGLWYAFGNEKAGYGKYYEGSSDISYAKDYTGEKITFNDEIVVFHGNRRLWENRDYTVAYSNNQKAAGPEAEKAPTVTIKGMGSYSGNSSFKFTIRKLSMDVAKLSSEKQIAVQAGAKLSTVKPIVTFGDMKLTVNKDYDLEFYKDVVSEETKVEQPANTAAEAGHSYIVSITANENGSFTGTMKSQVVIKVIEAKTGAQTGTQVKMSSVKVTLPSQPYSEDGIDIKSLFENGIAKVKNGKTDLVYKEDYEVVSDFSKVKDTGKYTFLIRGTDKKGEGVTGYVGDKTVTLTVTGIPASKVKVGGLSKTVMYKGSAFGINELYKADKTGYDKVTLYTMVNGAATVLTEGTDYVAAVSGSGAKGKLTVSFMLNGKYQGTVKKTVTVKAAGIGGADVKASEAVYSKAGATPKVIVSYNGITLMEGVDYTLSFKNNTKIAAGTAALPTVVVKGKGNFSGSKSQTFNIVKADITENVTVEVGDKVYSPKAGAYKAAVKLTDGGKALTAGTDIAALSTKNDIKYFYAESGKQIPDSAVVPSGTVIEVSVKVTSMAGSPYFEGTYELKGTYRIIDAGKDIKAATVKINNPSRFSFKNGKPVVPIKSEDLIVKLGKTVLSSSDYDIVSVSSNRFLGTAKVIIRGKGQYGGTKTFTFKVAAKALQ